MGQIVPDDDLPDEYKNSKLVPDSDMPETGGPTWEDPKGSIWYDVGRGAEQGGQELSAPGELARQGVSTARTLGNDFTRGLFHLPHNLVIGLPQLYADIDEYAHGTPWEKTSNFFEQAKGGPLDPANIDKMLGPEGLKLYTNEDPKDYRRYPGRGADFLAQTAATGGAGTARGLLGALGAGAGSQAAEDALPGNKYAPTAGGVLGLLAGGVTGGKLSPPRPSATPTVEDLTGRQMFKYDTVERAQIAAQRAMENGKDPVRAADKVIGSADALDRLSESERKEYLRLRAEAGGGEVGMRPLVKGIISHTVGNVLAGHWHTAARGLLDVINGSRRGPNFLKALDKLKDVVRTQQPYPRAPRFFQGNPRGLLGALGQNQ